jgi:hypothetical protein
VAAEFDFLAETFLFGALENTSGDGQIPRGNSI